MSLPATPKQAGRGPRSPVIHTPNVKLASIRALQPKDKRLPLRENLSQSMDKYKPVAKPEGVKDFPARTLAHPYVEKPRMSHLCSLEEVREAGSYVLESARYVVDSHELSDRLSPRRVLSYEQQEGASSSLVLECYKEHLRRYRSHFYGQEHCLFFSKSVIGTVVSAVGVHTGTERGLPVLSLGPNGYHSSFLQTKNNALPELRDLPRLFPYVSDLKFRMPVAGLDEKLSHDLALYEENIKPRGYKFGVLYVREGQTGEDEVYCNVDGSTQFVDFLGRLGDLIELKGHKGFRGGLDTRENATGELSVYRAVFFQNGKLQAEDSGDDDPSLVPLEVMFHVGPFLPHSDKEKQQLHKKRHIGNDIVVIVFHEGKQPLSPEIFTSQFNTVFIVVTPCALEAGVVAASHYMIEVVVKEGNKAFGPGLPGSPATLKAEHVGDWILHKAINGQDAVVRSREFVQRTNRTHEKMLAHWWNEYCDDRSKTRK